MNAGYERNEMTNEQKVWEMDRDLANRLNRLKVPAIPAGIQYLNKGASREDPIVMESLVRICSFLPNPSSIQIIKASLKSGTTAFGYVCEELYKDVVAGKVRIDYEQLAVDIQQKISMNIVGLKDIELLIGLLEAHVAMINPILSDEFFTAEPSEAENLIFWSRQISGDTRLGRLNYVINKWDTFTDEEKAHIINLVIIKARFYFSTAQLVESGFYELMSNYIGSEIVEDN